MVDIWAQSELETIESTRRLLGMVAAAGVLSCMLVLGLRHRLAPREFAWLTAASATLAALYAARSIDTVSGLLQHAAAPLFFTEQGRGIRAAWVIGGLLAGLGLSWLTVIRDTAADPPSYDDLPDDPPAAVAAVEVVEVVVAIESPAPVTWSAPAEVLDGGAPRGDEYVGIDEADVDYQVPPMFPALAWPSDLRAQLPLLTYALGIAALTAVFGSLVGAPIFSNGTTSEAAGAPFIFLAGVLTGLAALLPAWVHEDDVHVGTAFLGMALVASAFVINGVTTIFFRQNVLSVLIGLAAGTVIPTALYLVGELRAQVARRELWTGAVLALAAVVVVHVGVALAFEPNDDLLDIRRRGESVERH